MNQDLEAVKRAFAEFCSTVAALRHPTTGCPWDLEQDHLTLRRYMLEEAYEAVHAMSGGDATELCSELGDVLLQVVLNAQIARDHSHFGIVDVIKGIDAKMRRRHPHVFGGPDAKAEHEGITSGKVKSNWDVIKAAEKAAAKQASPASDGVFADADKVHPASAQAVKIGKIAAKIQFDWDSPREVLGQVRSELNEVEGELPTLGKEGADPKKLAEEIGDLYFSLAQLCRHAGLDPEVVSLDANKKFLGRFARLEKLAIERRLDVHAATREQLEALWQDVKRAEKR